MGYIDISSGNGTSRVESDTVRWQCPAFETSPSERVAWVESQISEGEGFLSAQKCYQELGKNLRVFDAAFRDKSRSSLITNELKYDIRKFCETLSEVREIAGYASDSPAYKKIAEMLTKVSKCVYFESDFPFQILKVLQYAAVMGIGYLWPKVSADEYGYGERKMRFEALGLLDVVPVQIPKSNDVQDAYAVTIYDYMPIAEAFGRFPLFQTKLQTVGRRNYANQVQARRQDFAEHYRYGDNGRSFGDLYTEIRYTFIRDLRINNTGFELPMGDIGTSWFYKVPTVGQQILGGVENGKPAKRTAIPEDCRVYPNLRLIITSSGLDEPMYDGPAFDWDSKMPIIQYTVDDWAWEPMGRSLVGDVATIETTVRKHERKMDAVITVRLNPPMGYNADENGGQKIEHMDLFEEDVRMGLFGGKPKETFQSVLPDEVNVTETNFKFLEYLGKKREKQLGLQDLGNMANLKLNVASADAMDKAIESIGPIAKGIAARVEKANKAVGNRVKFLILQWFDTNRIMSYVGPDNVAPEVFDYNPNDLVPSHMPDEMINGNFPNSSSVYDKLTRARWFAKQIRLLPVAGTLLKLTQQAEQLKFLTLKRTPDCPVSWGTVFKKLDIPDPEGEMEKYFKEQVQLTKMKIIAAALAQEEMKKMGMQPPEDGKGPGQKSGAHPGGRPGGEGKNPKSPRLAQKGGAGGEPRPVIKQS